MTLLEPSDSEELRELLAYVRVPEHTLPEVQEAIEAYTAKKVREIEKAYGGCRKCYGKGYATTIESTVWSDTDQDMGSRGGSGKDEGLKMKYCSCDRGKQLANLTSGQSDE